MDLSNEEIVAAIKKWQKESVKNTLHCDKDNCWEVVEPVIRGDVVVLMCVNCNALFEDMLKRLLEENNLIWCI